jgi:hypothetical protein
MFLVLLFFAAVVRFLLPTACVFTFLLCCCVSGVLPASRVSGCISGFSLLLLASLLPSVDQLSFSKDLAFLRPRVEPLPLSPFGFQFAERLLDSHAQW